MQRSASQRTTHISSSLLLFKPPTILIGFFPKLQLIKNQFRTISKWGKLAGVAYFKRVSFNERCYWMGGERNRLKIV